MQEQRLIELLIDLHTGLQHLAPGSEMATRQALAMCTELPDVPAILDIGCGSGAQTLALAAACPGRITAMDLAPVFLAQLKQRAATLGEMAKRIRPLVADMLAPPFADASFDLIWSEGAIYSMGFDKGLADWRPLVKPGGYLVVSELSWLDPDPPHAVRDYWRENYPAMRNVTENLRAAVALGWKPVGDFTLPVSAWHENYHAPLQRRFPEFLHTHPQDPDALAVVEETEREIAIMRLYPNACGYQFYVLRRPQID